MYYIAVRNQKTGHFEIPSDGEEKPRPKTEAEAESYFRTVLELYGVTNVMLLRAVPCKRTINVKIEDQK